MPTEIVDQEHAIVGPELERCLVEAIAFVVNEIELLEGQFSADLNERAQSIQRRSLVGCSGRGWW